MTSHLNIYWLGCICMFEYIYMLSRVYIYVEYIYIYMLGIYINFFFFLGLGQDLGCWPRPVGLECIVGLDVLACNFFLSR